MYTDSVNRMTLLRLEFEMETNTNRNCFVSEYDLITKLLSIQVHGRPFHGNIILVDKKNKMINTNQKMCNSFLLVLLVEGIR